MITEDTAGSSISVLRLALPWPSVAFDSCLHTDTEQQRAIGYLAPPFVLAITLRALAKSLQSPVLTWEVRLDTVLSPARVLLALLRGNGAGLIVLIVY